MTPMTSKRYQDRTEAGKLLALKLDHLKSEDVVVLALPRGGTVLAVEVAKTIHAPLDVVLVRKISHPFDPEFAIGAITENEHSYLTADANDQWLTQAEEEARALMRQRRKLYYDKDFSPQVIRGKTVILVDDGMATGHTMKAAAIAVRHQSARKVIVAIPVASQTSIKMLHDIVDDVIILNDPAHFWGSVGAHYENFNQISDNEVKMILRDYSSQTHRHR